jgi:hypothetical protein
MSLLRYKPTRIMSLFFVTRLIQANIVTMADRSVLTDAHVTKTTYNTTSIGEEVSEIN